MANAFGNRININILGSSHGRIVGVEAKGFPEGSILDIDEFETFMKRRSTFGENEVKAASATSRKERDKVIFAKGVKKIAERKMILTGEKVVAYVRNKDVKSSDYNRLKTVLRPGHADLGAFCKDGIEGLKAGGGRFSGRMTVALCIAGGIAKQILEKKEIFINADIDQIGGLRDKTEILKAIKAVKESGDSLGGTVICNISGFPAGIGGALFDGIEGTIAKAVFAIPAVKGIEFGSGFSGSLIKGSENNDEMVIDNGIIKCLTNNAGGISGGISNGNNIFFRIAIKPTPSISKLQKSVDVKEMKNTEISIKGRHDVCIVPRAVPVVEAVTALALLDIL